MSIQLIAACIFSAAVQMGVPAQGLYAIMEVEGGQIGTVSSNSNGTSDLGPMQINTIWIDDIAAHTGQTQTAVRHRLTNDACFNIQMAAWIFRQAIDENGTVWGGIGRYHSGTPAVAQRYLSRVLERLPRANANYVQGLQLLQASGVDVSRLNGQSLASLPVYTASSPTGIRVNTPTGQISAPVASNSNVPVTGQRVIRPRVLSLSQPNGVVEPRVWRPSVN